MSRRIRNILVANRGEIAVRVLRTVRALGYRGIAVYSTADADAPHVLAADRAICIGEPQVNRSYLSIPAILGAARDTGADAIHPGYGFLSENAEFAAACREAGIVFIGPSPEAIRAMGEKRLAKERMEAAGVPCIPGYRGADQSEAAMLQAAARIGYPLMIKASAGGGGRGIRLVHSEAELAPAMRTASSEALNAFGDGTLYLEKALINARHIEVQIMGDAHGHVVHLGERDCSTQRRNQKILEETPSPALNDAQRRQICADAVAAAKAIDYVGAGTVEFLLDQEGRHYFLEMNTRLQVEHPVTELVTGLDLVELQIRAAAGEPLGLSQDDIRFNGHAIEARLYAEDPYAGFAPQTGPVIRWQPAEGPHIRVDAGIREGQSVTPFYDPMLAKLIAWGETREDARRRLLRAVEDTVVMGVGTNRRYLARLLDDPRFIAGTVTTDHLAAASELSVPEAPSPLLRAAAALLRCWPEGTTCEAWRLGGPAQWRLTFTDRVDEAISVRRDIDGLAHVDLGNVSMMIEPVALAGTRLRLRIGPRLEQVEFCRRSDSIEVAWQGEQALFIERDDSQTLGGRSGAANGSLHAPMAGAVVKVLVAVGDVVEPNQCLFVIEAMKMETEIRAQVAGRVTALGARAGEQVSARQLLATIETGEAA